MNASKGVYKAINSNNRLLLLEKLLFDCSLTHNFDKYLEAAIAKGNTDSIEVIIGTCANKAPIKPGVLLKVPYSNHNEDKKLEMIKALLPNFDAHDPNWTDFYSIEYLFEVILGCCTKKNYILVEFFINNFYSQKYNSHYVLIKKLEAAVDGWQHICVLLHDDIDCYQSCEDGLHVYKSRENHFKNVAKTFLELLVKDTRASMDLAVEAFQVLIDKNFQKLFVFIFSMMSFMDALKIIERVLKDTLNPKLLFQFIYSSINDKTQQNIYDMIDFWLFFCKDDNPSLILSKKFLNSFIQQPLWKIIPDPSSDCSQTFTEQNGICSLKELARHVIRDKVFQNVSNVKEFFDPIGEFNIPATVKCFLLYIPDVTWMNNSQMS